MGNIWPAEITKMDVEVFAPRKILISGMVVKIGGSQGERKE